MTDYNHSEKLRPWGDDHNLGEVGIDRAALHGYWEYRDGTEGGELWFEAMPDGSLELTDYDGAFTLPVRVIIALRAGGIVVGDDCGPDNMPPKRESAEDRPPPSYQSAAECSIDEQAALYDDPYAWEDC